MTHGPACDMGRRFVWGTEPCTKCERDNKQTKFTADIEWFNRTGHCGGCGQPGSYCLCHAKAPCGCRDLHVMGSGVTADPLDMFAAPVSVDQQGLFDDGQATA